MEFPKFKQAYHLPGINLLPHRDPFLFVDELISADETGALLAGMGMRLGAEQAHAVHEATGGWATGIRLVALLCGDGWRVRRLRGGGGGAWDRLDPGDSGRGSRRGEHRHRFRVHLPAVRAENHRLRCAR